MCLRMCLKLLYFCHYGLYLESRPNHGQRESAKERERESERRNNTVVVTLAKATGVLEENN